MDTRSGDTFEVPMDPSARPLQAATAAKVGFRELNERETFLVRRCREEGERLRVLLEELDTSASNADKRWVSIARTHFQEGLMAAVRATTKPAFF